MSRPRASFWVLLGVILVLEAVAVWPSYYLATDDWFLVSYGRDAQGVESLFERQTRGTPAIRPVSLLLARAESALFGDRARPRLMVNVALHGLAAVLLTLLLLSVRARGAEAAGLVFLAWPLHAEVLGWYHSGHTTLPVAVLTLLTLLLYARRAAGWLTGLVFLVALLTRENALMALPVAFLWTWHATSSTRAALRRAAPLIVVAALFVAVRAWQMVAALSGDDTAYLPLNPAPWRALGDVLFRLLVPVHPSLPAAVALALLAGLLMATALWRGRGDWRPALLWIGLFCLPFLPVYDTSDALFVPGAAGYETKWYHLYLPLVALAAVVGRVLAPPRPGGRRAAQPGRLPRLVLPAAVALLLALQLLNASVWVRLGAGARRGASQLSALAASRRPLIFEFEHATGPAAEIAEHQAMAFHQIVPGHAVPIFRKKPGERSYIRERPDRYGYPEWIQVPRASLLPTDALRVCWRGAFAPCAAARPLTARPPRPGSRRRTSEPSAPEPP